MERNVREHDEVEIKPHMKTFDSGFYLPGKHLNPRNEHLRTGGTISPATNLHVAKLMNMKKSVMD
jgi:hypothetical protein